MWAAWEVRIGDGVGSIQYRVPERVGLMRFSAFSCSVTPDVATTPTPLLQVFSKIGQRRFSAALTVPLAAVTTALSFADTGFESRPTGLSEISIPFPRLFLLPGDFLSFVMSAGGADALILGSLFTFEGERYPEDLK